MRIKFIGVLTFEILKFFAGPVAQAAIVGKSDDRMPLTRFQQQGAVSNAESIRILNQVGLVYSEESEVAGTGLVSGSNCDTVITAGHVLAASSLNPGTRSNPLNNQFFDPEFYFDRIANTDSSSRVIVDPSSVGFNTSKTYAITGWDYPGFEFDWAVSKLQSRAKTCEPVTIHNKCKSKTFLLIGHASNSARHSFNKKLVSYPCKIENIGSDGQIPDQFYHDCDSGPMTSGAPIFCVNSEDQSLTLVGINLASNSESSGDYTENPNVGISITSSFRRLIENNK